MPNMGKLKNMLALAGGQPVLDLALACACMLSLYQIPKIQLLESVIFLSKFFTKIGDSWLERLKQKILKFGI